MLTDFVTDEYAVFERNENYWGEAPAIQKITVKVIPDNQTRIMALENEEIDLIFGKNMLDADAISQYVDSDRFTVSLSDPTSTRHIVLNTTHDILGDTAVRKALQHATNRQAISEGIFYGLEPAADTLYSPTVPYCDVDLEPMPTTPRKRPAFWTRPAGLWEATGAAPRMGRNWNWTSSTIATALLRRPFLSIFRVSI